VGAVPIPEATSWIARRLADLPPGALPKVPDAGQPPNAAFVPPSSASLEPRLLLVTWDVRGTFQHRLGAAVFASAMHALLALTPGIEVTWQDADVYPAGAYAALQLKAAPEVLQRLVSLLGENAARLSEAELDEALQRGAALAQRAQSASDAEASVRAEQVARSRLGARPATVTRDSAKALALALKKAAPRVIILR
jgi:hypothetical protein